MNSVRLWYKKSGLAVYTSHLDMNRCFTRAVRRAGIPLWYTEGFNPHPYLTFLLPLPLGTAGEREPLDIRTVENISAEEIKKRLNAVLPEGLEIVDVTEARDKANEIVSAAYEITARFESGEDAEKFAKSVTDIIGTGTLEAEKRSKRGIKTVNLCEFVRSFEAKADGNTTVIRTELLTGTQQNLNAGLLEEALEKAAGISPETMTIVRKEIYKDKNELFA